MRCKHPLDARQSPAGKIGFKPMTPFDKLIRLPCGKCIGCKLERSRQTAIRLMHEASLHQANSFVTLTYDNEHLPRARETHAHATLSKSDLQLFTKRLNESNRRLNGQGIRYYACGEYGEQTFRPHYHLAVFGEDFSQDRKKWKKSKTGHQLWRSDRLAALWPLGSADIGELTFESAAYVARYITKKITGPSADDHYKRQDEYGIAYWLEPEFNVMSRRPGLGKGWIDAYKTSVYPQDRVIVERGDKRVPSQPPRYYDNQLPKDELALLKQKRELARNQENESDDRLRAGEAILLARLKQLKRPLE